MAIFIKTPQISGFQNPGFPHWLEVWFADHYEDWLAGNDAIVKRATCATRAGGLAREQHDKDTSLLRNRARVAERLTRVIKAAVAGNNKGAR